MIKFLAFLIILVILFGVEATRAIIFGAFGFIFFITIALVLISFIIDFIEKNKEKEPAPKEKTREEPADYTSHKNALIFWFKAIVIISIAVSIFALIAGLINNPS